MTIHTIVTIPFLLGIFMTYFLADVVNYSFVTHKIFCVQLTSSERESDCPMHFNLSRTIGQVFNLSRTAVESGAKSFHPTHIETLSTPCLTSATQVGLGRLPGSMCASESQLLAGRRVAKLSTLPEIVTSR